MENKQNLNQNMDFLTFLKEINKLKGMPVIFI